MNLIARPDVRNVNFAFCTAISSWLADGGFPIDTSRPEAKDTKLNIGLKNIVKLKIVFHWVLPVLMIAFATLLLLRRNRK